MASPEERDLQRIADALKRIKDEAKLGTAALQREFAVFKEVLKIAGVSTAGVKAPATRPWGGRLRRSYLESFGMQAAGQMPPAYRRMAFPTQETLAKMPASLTLGRIQELTKFAGGAQNLQRVLNSASAALGGMQLGFESITKVVPDATRGITSFSIKTESGVGRAVVQMDKLGNMTVRTGRVARGFFEMVTRNIGKVIQWAVAVGVVYGAMRKLSQVMGDVKEFETLFADIAIVMGITTEAATQYFDAMYRIAKMTGITVKDVAGSFDEALRATANMADETERAVVIERLMVDAMTLAQLANISAAQSFDILIGALRQMGYGLDEGTRLLDKWIAVSRVSVASVYGLAQGFGITGTAADTAGISVDQLTAMIATMMEVTVLSETQAANAIRAFTSSFTTERSVAALAQFGFAVTDLDGSFRSLWDILSEVSAAFEAGALSPTGLKQIADAIGGGYRRAAQVEAMIKGWPRAQYMSAISMDAHGEAAEALETKMDTLQIAVNEMTSAWQRFAETLMEAGLAEDLARIVDLMTGLLDLVSNLTERLGPFLIRLAEMMALIGLARYAGPKIGTMLGMGGMQMALPGMGAGMLAGAAGTAAKFAGPLAIAATAAIPIITEGLTQEAAWQSAGGVLAGAVGLVLGGPMGAVIGGAIGQGIVQFMQRQAEEMAIPLDTRSMDWLTTRQRELEATIGGLPTGVGAGREMLGEDIFAMPRGLAEKELAEVQAAIERKIALRKAGWEEEKGAAYEYYQSIVQLEEDLGDQLPDMRKRTLALLTQYTTGEITKAEYKALQTQLESAYNIIFLAYKEWGEGMGLTISEVFEILATAPLEVIEELNARTTALVAIQGELAKLKQDAGKTGLAEIDNIERSVALRGEERRILEEQVHLLELAKEAMKGPPAEVPPIVDFSKIAEEDLPRFFDDVVTLMQEVADVAGIPFEVMFEDAAYVGFTEGLKMFLVDPTINRQIASLVSRAWETAADEMDLRRIKDIGDMQAATWFAKLKEFVAYYQRLFAQIGFAPEMGEITLMLGPQNEIFRLMTSQEALRYAIEDLRDITEEQTDILRGHYNIPAGYVVPTPWDYYATGATDVGPVNYPPSVLEDYYGYQFGGGGGGGGGLGIPAVGGVEAGQWMERIPRQPGWDVGDWTGLIMQYALQAGVDPRIIAAIMQIESGGRPDVWGAPTKYGRAAGLMQVMPFHAGRLQPGEDLMQPEANIRVGVEIFKELLDKYGGDVMRAVAGYYGGVIGGEVTPAGEEYLAAFEKGFSGLFGVGVGEIQQVQGIPEIQRVLESTKISGENYGAQSINQMIQMVGLLRSILSAVQTQGGITTVTLEDPGRRPRSEPRIGDHVLSNERPGGPVMGGWMET